MKAMIALGAVAGLLALQTSELPELVRKDRERLQGTWKVIAAETGGEKVPAKDLAEMFLIFEDDTIQVRENKKVQVSYRFKLDPERKPKEINFTYTSGPKKDRTDRGIYLFQGERLTFCIQEDPLAPRPKVFDTESEGKLSLVVLERLKKK
jgi:uncharacterized protein (TIGR03067 family)